MPITGGGAGSQLPRGVRERYADFLADNAVMVGTSILRRPDSISFDYLTAHTVGPAGIGDTSQGIVSWVWKARATATQLFIARENATRDGWLAETLLFNYGGVAIAEMDFCFDQNGSPIVVAERGGELWIYYSDITLGGYGFRDFGPGRTPRAVLDDPLDVNGSDVLVFYVSDTGIVYRQQRDRYAVAYPTTATGANPVPIPDQPPMNYGPVLFAGKGESISSGITPHAEVGNMRITMTDGHASPLDVNDLQPTDRFARSPAHLTVSMHFSQMVYGFDVEMFNHWLPQFGGGGVDAFRLGLHVGAAGFTTPIFPSDPVGHARFNFAAGFDTLLFSAPAGDHSAMYKNLALVLSPAQLDDVKANVCAHGPALFDYTGDPTVISATVDGITIEARAPLDIINSVPVDVSSLLNSLVPHENTPGVFRPMAWDDIERPYGVRYDPDGARIQPSVIQAAQRTNGSNRNVQGTDLVLTFSSVVNGVEIEAVGSPYFDNLMIAYNAAGVEIARVTLLPPVAFALYSGIYRIFVPGIKTLRLVPAVTEAIGINATISWTNLKFKKVGDLPSDGGGAVPIPPQVFPPAPIPPKTDVFIEDAVRTPDGRVSIVYSVREASTGTYSFGRIDTVLYPYHCPSDGEGMNQSIIPTNAILFLLVKDYAIPYNFEGMTEGFGLTPSGIAALVDLSVPVVVHPQPWVDEAMIEGFMVPSGVLFLVIHDWDQYYNLEGMTQVLGSRLGFLTQVVFDQLQPYVDEGMTQGYGVQSVGNSLA